MASAPGQQERFLPARRLESGASRVLAIGLGPLWGLPWPWRPAVARTGISSPSTSARGVPLGAVLPWQAVDGGNMIRQLRAPAWTALQGPNLAEACRRLMAEILAGTDQAPLGKIRFSPRGEVIQTDFFMAQARMEPGGRRGRFALLP